MLLLPLAVHAQIGGLYDLSWNTVDGGGITGAIGGPYSLNATVGQPDVGLASGGVYEWVGGFWSLPIGIDDGGARLTITRIGFEVRVTWPAGGSDWVLETCPNLGASRAWSAVTPAPSGNSYTASAATGQSYFRLRKR